MGAPHVAYTMTAAAEPGSPDLRRTKEVEAAGASAGVLSTDSAALSDSTGEAVGMAARVHLLEGCVDSLLEESRENRELILSLTSEVRDVTRLLLEGRRYTTSPSATPLLATPTQQALQATPAPPPAEGGGVRAATRRSSVVPSRRGINDADATGGDNGGGGGGDDAGGGSDDPFLPSSTSVRRSPVFSPPTPPFVPPTPGTATAGKASGVGATTYGSLFTSPPALSPVAKPSPLPLSYALPARSVTSMHAGGRLAFIGTLPST
eukprot:Rhum_TRINITY_DN17372_c0_g1::Rhum_TRINITY_DN17372_c0_g1_i1::g.165809::m.165809